MAAAKSTKCTFTNWLIKVVLFKHNNSPLKL